MTEDKDIYSDESEDDLIDWLKEELTLIEEQLIIAGHCTCGAWILSSDGLPLHIGDCSCGAQEGN